MACAVLATRRSLGGGRRFLLEDEVHQLADSDDNSRAALVAGLPVDEEFKGQLYKTQNVPEAFSSLEQFGSGVCRVEVARRGHEYVGSGFYFGSGWVLTTSHVLRNREMLENARFVFVSPEFGEVAFEARPRRGMAHRLLPAGRRTDYHNRDVALAKLGVQCDRHNGHKLEGWEEEEEQLLKKLKPFDFTSLAQSSFLADGDVPLGPRASDLFSVIHFGGPTGVKQFTLHLAAHEVWKFVDLRLVNFACPLEAPASGCPVLLWKDGAWLLAGVFVGGALYGTQAPNVGAGQAVVWNRDTIDNIDAGRQAMKRVESFRSYSVFVSFQERLQLLNDKSVRETAQLALKHRILIV